ncbi:hypothetical protein NEPAR06_2082 [Nematocida parisii]|uniref:Uncharacterized protein n=1 Tax=Nematocida parisii (strain ERTm3) TaxID=935791 RepID=I3EI11_NEMP3|nr:uncharacterized protein NEPG_02455 [Nematocida parisii ERTm1]EIJ88858.1 hypothetical protein NEQG_00677 [Nematocida parisii ERTm3]KAI5125867.1 hypothetical protein NEPAR03_0304 [Nematocida parisii]EIJ92764.1 hypothetical protein NEPG_02455 [Nematocida parisii ERTm1]KAI5129880.1 hypothetical protein NEPAR08_1761 [Nematocida parisii]KAI5142963.1 hypothetical protein NEPAR04_1703 [Nematocida parisii]|eukprot:XP_013060282.1 hypothetical protein NEPG_02455 [Nematocida parisii ERTm1]
MNLKVQLLLVTASFGLIMGGILTTLFITRMPRDTDYTVEATGVSDNEELLKSFKDSLVTETTWLDVLWDFSIINSKNEITENISNIQFFTDISVDTPITSLNLLDGPMITSNKDYIIFENNPEIHYFYFSSSKNSSFEYVIHAYNHNLFDAQTGVCIFYREDKELKGYLLNNIRLRAVRSTKIILLVENELEIERIMDFNGNSHEFI